MAKKKSVKKDLLKKEPIAPTNLTYADKVALSTSGSVKIEKEKTKRVEKDAHVQYTAARPKTSINQRLRIHQ
tara:strand:- start:1115 stop:1330 length:216 start_codon:yes stop_codon:yes gene_type:complete